LSLGVHLLPQDTLLSLPFSVIINLVAATDSMFGLAVRWHGCTLHFCGFVRSCREPDLVQVSCPGTARRISLGMCRCQPQMPVLHPLYYTPVHSVPCNENAYNFQAKRLDAVEWV
jgi:hypothetical protein